MCIYGQNKMWQNGRLDVGDGIAGETATKLMHEEIGILSVIWFRWQTVYLMIKFDETHQTFRFEIKNIKERFKKNRKNKQENPIYWFWKDFTHGTFLVGHEKPFKDVIIWTYINLHEGITGETAIKLLHEEIGILKWHNR